MEKVTQEFKANMKLYMDAQDTTEKTGKLPSELAAENEELLEALKEMVCITKIHSKATKNNFAWAELEFAEKALEKATK